MKFKYLLFAIALLAQGPLQARDASAEDAPMQQIADLAKPDYYVEVLRHLYRWYLDGAAVAGLIDGGEETLFVEELHPTLDEGDRSQFARLTFASLGIAARVKRSDYEIPELEFTVHSEQFKIIDVEYLPPDSSPAEQGIRVRFNMDDVTEQLSLPESELRYPNDALLMRMGDAVKRQFGPIAEDTSEVPVFHVSPLSPVIDELWVFVEQRRELYHFSADAGVDAEGLWDAHHITTRRFDLDEQVIVTQSERPGSNAFVTRDFVGRALYNCIVLGKRNDRSRQR
ncbi:hypothetical protein OAS86_05935 [Gammaproteobacteria bacterium]|nr:hypothetical protein [Gammaproteobacteria bacterium]